MQIAVGPQPAFGKPSEICINKMPTDLAKDIMRRSYFVFRFRFSSF